MVGPTHAKKSRYGDFPVDCHGSAAVVTAMATGLAFLGPSTGATPWFLAGWVVGSNKNYQEWLTLIGND